jgi:hypothetical protein
VRFRWSVDRWAHDILWRGPDGWILLFESVEGSSVSHWPASPPLVSLEIDDQRENTRTALLVGMAGKCHWSLSVEFDRFAGRARFDAACRVRGARGPLGSRYQLLQTAASVNHQVACVGGLHVYTDRHFESRLSVAERNLSIVPMGTIPGDEAQTIRWAYTFGVTNPIASI